MVDLRLALWLRNAFHMQEFAAEAKCKVKSIALHLGGWLLEDLIVDDNAEVLLQLKRVEVAPVVE